MAQVAETTGYVYVHVRLLTSCRGSAAPRERPCLLAASRGTQAHWHATTFAVAPGTRHHLWFAFCTAGLREGKQMPATQSCGRWPKHRMAPGQAQPERRPRAAPRSRRRFAPAEGRRFVPAEDDATCRGRRHAMAPPRYTGRQHHDRHRRPVKGAPDGHQLNRLRLHVDPARPADVGERAVRPRVRGDDRGRLRHVHADGRVGHRRGPPQRGRARRPGRRHRRAIRHRRRRRGCGRRVADAGHGWH